MIKNARIESTALGIEDGPMMAWLHLDYGGSGQGFGGYALDEWSKGHGRRIGTAYGCEFIVGILNALEVRSWEKLKGTLIRVETEGEFGKILRIGHPLKDQWFDPRELHVQ